MLLTLCYPSNNLNIIVKIFNIMSGTETKINWLEIQYIHEKYN